ncbi:oligoendopeptidase F [Criibacterium bergeronii]|uniref:Oligopeptidase F n=1 Tax=Criibacterium bergeronii TaxID=1871336 RepID=A0A552VCU8_9FIRM|nr:oligoendopeptidase F [Criibacterium bergeronii]TRW28294.1 oligoendopeptidase F [Criibacterium bergeronii]
MTKYDWDLSKIYKNNEEIEVDKQKINEYLQIYSKEVENKDIEKVLTIAQKASKMISKLYAYSMMKKDENAKNQDSVKLSLEIEALSAKVNNVFSSLEPMIIGLDDETINKFLNTTDKKDYAQVVTRILRKKQHILSKQEEEILSVTEDIANDSENNYYMLSYADMQFGKLKNGKELSHANYINFQQDKDIELRKESFELMHDTYGKYINTFSSNYYSHVKAKEKIAKLRKFTSNRNEELFADNIDEQVYDSLIDAVTDYIPDLSKYIDYKKKKLGLEEISNYDLYVELSDKNQKKYSYEQGKTLVKEALKPLGKDYSDILANGLESNWIDVYPKDGKKSGGYSFGTYDTDPYILLNYTDNISSVFTLAHELGHSMHSYYSRKNNPYYQSNYTIFVAEVASTTNELLLFNYLKDTLKDEDEKQSIILYNLEQYRTTVFRQTMFAEFEKIVHSKVANDEALTADMLDEIYFNLNKKYYPTVSHSDGIAREWARIPHFYSDYYVYKYATGFVCASVLSQNILNADAEPIDYLNFLKDGNKNYPIEQLKMAGVDISKKETVAKALDAFVKTVNELK